MPQLAALHRSYYAPSSNKLTATLATASLLNHRLHQFHISGGASATTSKQHWGIYLHLKGRVPSDGARKKVKHNPSVGRRYQGYVFR